jgi:hypothetical protein
MRPESIQGRAPWRLFSTSSVVKLNGNRHVGILNRNDAKRNANLNYFDNDWNANYRFLAVRHYLFFLPDLHSGSFLE